MPIGPRVTRKQRTIGEQVAFSGHGLFTGVRTRLAISPADTGSGIVLRRTDLAGAPEIVASTKTGCPGVRTSLLREGGVTIQTVEHLLAAVHGLGIDNAVIELNGPEVPILDGSSQPFVREILRVGIKEQADARPVFVIREPIFYERQDAMLIAIPSDSFRVTYVLDCPGEFGIPEQIVSLEITPELFAEKICFARTFGAYEEIAPLIEQGFVRGGDLTNAVIVREGRVVNPEGLRSPEEFALHKILDLIGDVGLVGPFVGHLVAIRSGHAANWAMAQLIQERIAQEEATWKTEALSTSSKSQASSPTATPSCSSIV